MANRPRAFGLTAEINRKMAAKYEVEKEQEVRLWMEDVIGQPLAEGTDSNEPLGPAEFQKALKNGIFLCKLRDAIMGPGKKPNTSNFAFKQMENISSFLSSCEEYGVAKTDLFQTVDLYENQNLWAVITAIYALGRKAQANGFAGPALGPRESQRNVREFSDEQLAQSNAIIGLQMGTNKMASQKGMSFGNTRHIADIKVEEGSKEGQSVIGLQMGTNRGASQKGMSFGQTRHIADVKVEDSSREGQGIIGLQAGSNQGASQAGMTFGKSRSIVD